MRKIAEHWIRWWRSLATAFASEMSATFFDKGVLIFFLGLPLFYPIVYTLIYNPEIADNIPVAIVDHCRTTRSREFSRMIDATQAMNVYGYPEDIPAARHLLNNKDVVAIIEIPADYDRCIGRGDQATVPLYCDMSLLLRYRAIYSAMTQIQMQLGTDIRAESIDRLGMLGQTAMSGSKPVEQAAFVLGDTSQGFASFVMPGLFMLILQQSMLLGITMLAAGRRRGRYPVAPLTSLPASATVIGKTLCYVTIYLPMTIYIVTIIPWMFKLPSVAPLWQYILFTLPLLVSSAMLGQVVQVFVSEREASMPVIVFTSVIFLFLSGLTWPRFAMPAFWQWVGDTVPATWAVEGFVQMSSNGGSLAEESFAYNAMWILAGAYFLMAWMICRYQNGRTPIPLPARQ